MAAALTSNDQALLAAVFKRVKIGGSDYSKIAIEIGTKKSLMPSRMYTLRKKLKMTSPCLTTNDQALVAAVFKLVQIGGSDYSKIASEIGTKKSLMPSRMYTLRKKLNSLSDIVPSGHDVQTDFSFNGQGVSLSAPSSEMTHKAGVSARNGKGKIKKESVKDKNKDKGQVEEALAVVEAVPAVPTIPDGYQSDGTLVAKNAVVEDGSGAEEELEIDAEEPQLHHDVVEYQQEFEVDGYHSGHEDGWGFQDDDDA